jgi:hypothetical protein
VSRRQIDRFANSIYDGPTIILARLTCDNIKAKITGTEWVKGDNVSVYPGIISPSWFGANGYINFRDSEIGVAVIDIPGKIVARPKPGPAC